MGFVVREAKKVLWLQMTRDHGIVIQFKLIFSLPNVYVVTRKDLQKKKEGRRSTMRKFPKTALFEHIFIKIKKFTF
jgi:hypothetical protein